MSVESQRAAPFRAFATASKAAIVEEATRIAALRYGNALRAIVLTGSLARDEATLVDNGTCFRLLGDADFFLVFRENCRMPNEEEIKSVSTEISSALQRRGLSATVSLGPIKGSYLRHLRNHIATYELRSCGQVVWGDGSILLLVPAFARELLSREDAWRLLVNRMIEQLDVLSALDDVLSPEAQYRTVKLYLDIATSYLVFAGRYQPTYLERERALRELLETSSASQAAPFSLAPFADRVSACTKFKLEGHGLPGEPWEFWTGAVSFAYHLWQWELVQLTGQGAELSDSELMSCWMTCQSVTTRLRGWASAFRRTGWRRGRPEWPRWIRLARQASPRYWVYSVAASLFFRLPYLLKHEGTLESGVVWGQMMCKLPLPDGVPSQGRAPDWQELARVTAWNYHAFLEGTIA